MNFAEKAQVEGKSTKVSEEKKEEVIEEFSDSNEDPENDW